MQLALYKYNYANVGLFFFQHLSTLNLYLKDMYSQMQKQNAYP